jgi:CheY-like chemotaxis protein
MRDSEFSADLQDCFILLVEDEAVTAIDMTSIIETAGGKVVGPAYSLGQGFHLLQHDRIDCAVLDINLNCLVVFGLADALAERNVPIVFLSADSLDTAPLQHRARKLVRKPFSTRNLVAAIKGAIADIQPSLNQPVTVHDFQAEARSR